jgi:hypothetical protein
MNKITSSKALCTRKCACSKNDCSVSARKFSKGDELNNGETIGNSL